MNIILQIKQNNRLKFMADRKIQYNFQYPNSDITINHHCPVVAPQKGELYHKTIKGNYKL